MYQIQQITDDPSQSQTLVLPDGTQIGFSITYLPTQQIWSASITYQDFSLNNLLVVNNTNLLAPWINIIPFGLACVSVGAREPSQLQDFFSAYSSLFILSSADLTALDAILAGG